MFYIDSIITTVNQLDNLFTTVKSKLLNTPGTASGKLAEVLDELSKVLDFIEKETVKYLEIIFLPDKSNFIANRSILLSLESGYVGIKGYETRGHCHKIGNIYEAYLNKWFGKILDPAEAEAFARIFTSMNTADLDMIRGIESVTDFLKYESQEVLDLIDGDRLEEANAKIKAARKDLQQTRRDIVAALSRLKLLQASFIASAETV